MGLSYIIVLWVDSYVMVSATILTADAQHHLIKADIFFSEDNPCKNISFNLFWFLSLSARR